jgi:hypothetical protein
LNVVIAINHPNLLLAYNPINYNWKAPRLDKFEV